MDNKDKTGRRRNFIDDFLDSEENQQKFGFTTDKENGETTIYYDGNWKILMDALFGSKP